MWCGLFLFTGASDWWASTKRIRKVPLNGPFTCLRAAFGAKPERATVPVVLFE